MAAAISNKPIPLLAMLTIMIMTQTVYSATEFAITFEGFDNEEIHLEGDATISANNEIQLTKINADNGNPLPRSVGRVSYSQPIRLWDSSTGEIPHQCSLLHSSRRRPRLLHRSFQRHPPPDSYGSLLGLFSGPPGEIHSNNIVAVEFDTFTNHGYQDPDYKHIGIDVNSIVSEATTEWRYWRNGVADTVRVNYNPYSKILKVSAQYTSGESIDLLSHEVDLAAILPEWVRIGFSGATGDYTQSNVIQYWFLHTKLLAVNNGGVMTARRDNNNEGYIIASVV
ncbi:hypothetical protein PIB30_026500 [Stylosanthes scabra]|uniref:Legume lectin domain-containing protein n=1 Tax=Stylosanthes scabra TaxID=79078 RepID=A0ABU6YAN3_9FABA|nr:hypothetical protein [Stylosanthes scabra]